jgi:hypothetical protein
MKLIADEELPVLLIDNVAEYYYAGTGQEYWDITVDFPNIAPVFPAFWAEHKFPKRIHSDTKGDRSVESFCPDGRSGWLVATSERKDVSGEGIPEGTKWVMVAEHFIDWGRAYGIEGPSGTLALAIDEHGRLIDTPIYQTFAEADSGAEELMKNHGGWMHPVLLAISFLHCKNVQLVENEAPPKLAKKYHAKTGRYPTPYKTLVIEPLKQILRKEGGSDEVGIAKAMHICRGHFKDYREGKGLFGKYHKLVWQPSLVRGTKHRDGALKREIEVKV